jgi:hypothetical protein
LVNNVAITAPEARSSTSAPSRRRKKKSTEFSINVFAVLLLTHELLSFAKHGLRTYATNALQRSLHIIGTAMNKAGEPAPAFCIIFRIFEGLSVAHRAEER